MRHARADRTVRVHHRRNLPHRWTPGWHRTHVHHVAHWRARYWAPGVFIYSPPPSHHHVVVVDPDTGREVRGAAAEPTRAIDRGGELSLGLRGGSTVGGIHGGGSYGDFGMGLALRYRPVEALGLELSWQHTSDTWGLDAQRESDPLSASVELFAFPWSRVSPYAMAGLTWTPRSVDQTYRDVTGLHSLQATDTLFGPHYGVGLELAVGENASLNFEGKAIRYVNVPLDDPTVPAALQGTMGLNVYF